VSEALRESYGDKSVVQFYGAVKERDREEAVARFEGERIIMGKGGNVLRTEPVPDKERARFMIAQQRAGGVGQTWVAASLSLHYSNTFSLIDRLQAEDRPHRIGQRKTVQYIDIEAMDTIDSVLIGSMIAKKDVADVINNDPTGEWLK
jgi:SNF2 family DNA or RNA helicase